MIEGEKMETLKLTFINGINKNIENKKEEIKMKRFKTIFFIILLVSILLPVSANAYWFSCQAEEVMEFNNRIHVRCSNPLSMSYLGVVSNVRWIAIGKDDTAQANRFTSLATTAVISGYTFIVSIRANSNYNTPGCNASDCRTPTAFGLQY